MHGVEVALGGVRAGRGRIEKVEAGGPPVDSVDRVDGGAIGVEQARADRDLAHVRGVDPLHHDAGGAECGRVGGCAEHRRYGHVGVGERAQHAAFAEHVVGLKDAALALDAQHDRIAIFKCEAPGEIGDAAIEPVQRGDLRRDAAVFERGCRER